MITFSHLVSKAMIILVLYDKRCKGADARYQATLEDNKAVQVKSKKDSKRKPVSEEVSDRKRKCQANKSILSLSKDIVKFSLEAKEKPDFDLLNKPFV